MKHILSYLTITLLFTSCQLFEPKPESEKFYCKINGRTWRPEANSYSLGPNLKAELNKKGRFTISAFNELSSIFLSIKVEENARPTLREYILSNDITMSTGTYNYNTSLNPSQRIISKSGYILISKIDNSTVSGTFEFTTYSDIKKKTYKITKGQFNDLTYSEIG